MSDMGDDFRALREMRQKKRGENLDKFLDHDIATKLGLKQHTGYHYSMVFRGHTLDYWPSSGKWRYRQRSYNGDLRSFQNWLKNQTAKAT